MATSEKDKILEETDLFKNRPELTFDANKENYFVFNMADIDNTGGLVDAYDDFADFYGNSKRTIRFKGRRMLKKQLKMLPFTLVKTDNIEFTISDKKGREKIVVLVKVVDNDPVFSKKDISDNPKPADLPVLDASYYIEKRFLHPVDPERTDPPQAKVVIEASTGKKKKVEDWYKQPTDTILETDDTFYVIKETVKQSWKDDVEQRAVYLGTKEAALEFFIKHYEIEASKERVAEMLYKSEDAGIYVPQRPKAKCKMLVGIPKQLLTADDIIKDLSNVDVTHTLESPSLGDLRKNVKKIAKYMRGISREIRKHNIDLNALKESNNFMALSLFVIQMFETNKTYPTREDEQIKIFFGGEGPSVVGLQAYPKDVEDHLFPSDGELTPEEKAELSKPVDIKLVKSFTTNVVFEWKRSMFYLINSDLMAKEIEKTDPKSSKWYEIISKYTFDMPEYKPSSKKTKDEASEPKKVKEELETAEEEFSHGMTHSEKEAALSVIGPALKQSVGNIQRTMFEKIEDPTIKRILNNIEQINSIESLYGAVLDKIPTEKLLRMASNAVTSKIPKDVFLNGPIETVNNIESMNFSANSAKDALLGTGLVDQGFLGKAFDFSDKINEGMSFDFSSGGDEIFDVTEGKDEEIFALVKDVVTSTVVEHVKTILRTIKNNFFNESEMEKIKKIGSFNLKENLKSNSLASVKNNINSLSGALLENKDVSNILDIISSLATPLEILAIFEGRGDLDVIDIICTEISEQYPLLAARLISIYQKEDFLMIMGKDILEEVTMLIGEESIRQKREEPPSLDFCGDDDAEDFIDHLTGRFPEEFLKEQEEVRKQSAQELKNLIDDISTALENGDIEDFLFGGKIKELLNSIVEDNRSSDVMLDMVVRAYFGPIQAIYALEALTPGDIFMRESIVEDTDKKAQLPMEIQVQINRLLAVGQEDTAKKIKKKAADGKKKIAISLKNNVKELYENFFNGPAGIEKEDSYRIGLGNKNMTISFSNMKSYDSKSDPLTGSLEEPIYKWDTDPPTPDFATFSVKAMLNNKMAINSAKEIKLKETIMHKKGYLNVENIDMSPRKAGFLSFVKEIIEESMPSNLYTPTTLQKALDDLKHPLFDYSTKQYINFLAREASKSPFFKIPVLKKLKFTPTDGDTRVPPLACDQLETEEAAKVQTNQDDLIEEIILLEDIEYRFSERRKYFSSLQRERGQKIYNRTDIENAMLMEITESFFKVLALEFLISGVFIFSEIKIESLIEDKNNFKIMQDIMFFTMQRLGDEFRNKFSEYLEQYIELKKDMLDEDSLVGEENSEQNLDDLYNINKSDKSAIINYIFKEQLSNVFGPFQKSVQLLSDKQNLEINEFLDIIPNLDIAESSITPPGKGRFTAQLLSSDPLSLVRKVGGFILEKYIRVDYQPTKQNPKLTDFLFGRSNVLKIPSQDLDGNFMWLIGGTEQQVETDLTNKYFNRSADKIWAEANKNLYNNKYNLYKKRVGGMWKVLSKSEIFNIIKTQYSAKGTEFGATLPDYEEFLGELQEINYTPEAENVAYEYPNYLGAVKLSAFEEMQDFVRKDINAELTKKLESSIEKYETLANSTYIFNTLNEEVLDLKTVWNAEYNILTNKLDVYIEKNIAPYSTTMLFPQIPGISPLPPITDEPFFKWKESETKLKEMFSPSPDKLYGVLSGALQLAKKDIIDDLYPKMIERRDNLDKLLNDYKKGKIKVQIDDEDISTIYEHFSELDKRIKTLKELDIVKNFDELDTITDKLEEKINELEDFLDEYAYDTDPKEFFLSQLAAAEEAQQKAFGDYNTFGVAGSHTEMFKPLKYGIRLSYVYPGTVGAPPPSIENIRKNIRKVVGDPRNWYNRDEKYLNTQEIYWKDKEKQSVDNVEIYSLPLLEIEDKVENYFETLPPKPSEGRFDKEPEKNSSIPLIQEEIVQRFPLDSLKKKMINSETYNMIMSEMYSYGDFVTALGAYSSLHSLGDIFQNLNLGIFSGTKINLKNAFESVYESKDFSYINDESLTADIMKNNIVKMTNTAEEPSKEEGFPKTDFGYAAAFAAKTGMVILKHFVEKTDPAIIRAKQIQEMVVKAAEIGEEISEDIDELANISPTGVDSAAALAAKEGMLLPIVMFGVRPMPPIPFPIGDPTAPLTGPGAAYLALAAAGAGSSVMSSGDTPQDVIEKENPDKKCDDK